MILSAPAGRAVSTRAGWSVARLLTGLGLVLVLLMGCWAATHSEMTEGPATAPIAELIAADEPGVVQAAATAGEYSGATGDLGAALCLLGVVCMLALAVLAWRVPSRRYSLGRVAGVVRELIAAPRSQVPVLTLSQLCVSRT